MGTVIALANQKGGVGKTTTTISLGAALGELGQRVLLVDFDPQGAMSVGVGVNPNGLDQTIYNLLLDRSTRFEDVVLKTNVPGVELLPGNIDLSAAEVVLVSEVAREQALKRVLSAARHEYDYVLIDCPPSLGLLTVNALTAADSVIIPLECEFFALRGMALLVDTIEKVRDRLNPELRIQGVVATMFDGRMLHSREVLERVRDAFGAKLFDTTIPRTIRFAEAPVAGQPIQQYDSGSKGAQAYRSLAKEVLGIHDDQTSEPSGSGGVLPGIEPDAAGASSGPDAGAAAGDRAPAPDLAAARHEDPSPEPGEPSPAARGEGDVLLHS
jgi:chromosome partitioning protein